MVQPYAGSSIIKTGLTVSWIIDKVSLVCNVTYNKAAWYVTGPDIHGLWNYTVIVELYDSYVPAALCEPFSKR